jgi:hypothetical protein
MTPLLIHDVDRPVIPGVMQGVMQGNVGPRQMPNDSVTTARAHTGKGDAWASASNAARLLWW